MARIMTSNNFIRPGGRVVFKTFGVAVGMDFRIVNDLTGEVREGFVGVDSSELDSISYYEEIGGMNWIYTAPDAITSESIFARDLVMDDDFSDPPLVVNTVSPLGVISGIARQLLSLDQDQVYLYNQDFKIPDDERPYINVGIASNKNFSANYFSTSVELLLEINLFGKTDEVLILKDKFIVAMQSDDSQLIQNANAVKIARHPTQITNLSDLEDSTQIYRFVLQYRLYYSYNTDIGQRSYENFDRASLIKNS